MAFQQGRLNDDRWLTEYASTCFSNDSLLWYSDLDDETCSNWKKLRKAFLQRYYHSNQNPEPSPLASHILESLGSPSPFGPPVSVPTPAQSAPSSCRGLPGDRRGIIEVFLNKSPKTVGFLTYDRVSSKFSIIQNPSHAQVISFPAEPNENPFTIRIVRLNELSSLRTWLKPF